MNGYARLDEIKEDLVATGSNARDATLGRLIVDVSRAWDDLLGRHFYDVVATRDFDVPGSDSLILELDADVVSIASVAVDADADGTFETSIPATDYFLLPTTVPPRRFLEHENTYWTKGRARVRVVGSFGYSFESELLAGKTVQDNPLSSSATTLTITNDHGLSVGETIIVEDEQIHVSAKPTATTLTIVRAINGTTAAAHVQGTAIYRRRYPRPIERATAMQVVRLARDMQTGFSGQSGNAEFGYNFATLFPAIRDMLAPYRVPGGTA